MGTRQRRLLLIIAALTLTTFAATSVQAHAQVKSSEPANRAVMQMSPAQVVLVFTEETSPTKSDGVVSDQNTTVVSTGFKVDLNDRTKMTISLKSNLPNGTYFANWKSFTEEDSGTAQGTVSFTVQAQAQAQVTNTIPAATVSPTSTTTGSGTTATPTSLVAGTVPSGSAPGTAFTGVRADITATRPPVTVVAGTIVTVTTPIATLPPTGTKQQSGVPAWIVALIVLGGGAVVLGLGLYLSRRYGRHFS